MIKKHILLLIGVVILGFGLRIFAINWDYGFHLHPDERAIILYTLPLQFPTSIQDFFSSQSTWNPNFFAYGSFPLYLLKIVGFFASYLDTIHAGYDHLTIIGRFISALFDTATVLCIYLLSKQLFKSTSIGIVSSFLYTSSVLAIQLSHFYAVDTLLTFFITYLLYKLLIYYEHPLKKTAIRIGIIFGFALAVKISSIVAIVPTIVTFILLFTYKYKHMSTSLVHALKQYVLPLVLIIISGLMTFFILEPYAFIDFSSFLQQSQQQSEMTKSAFTFPYTLQYVGKIPYIYELLNIIYWGMGPVLGTTALVGFCSFLFYLMRTKTHKTPIIILSFFLTYFLVVGGFAIGFMRYLLPIYPLLCIFAGNFIYRVGIFFYKSHKKLTIVSGLIYFILLMIWPFSFLAIYTHTPTRVSATNWVLQNIPKGKTIAIEHWDDALPLFGQENYTMVTLELYNPDTTEKWEKINEQLTKTDYIILASNRLYTPLQKLTDCDNLPALYCYKQTSQYYKNLFSGKLGFKKEKEFYVYPSVPLTSITIPDDSADESFTVYDHPKVIIFKRM